MLLQVENLSFQYRKGLIFFDVLFNINFTVEKRDILGILGESGCGKTTLALCCLNLILPYEGRIKQGKVYYYFNNSKIDFLGLPIDTLRKYLGKEMGIVFQDPFSALNPVFTIEQQIKELFVFHNEVYSKSMVCEFLNQLGLDDTERILRSYPHQLSGGQRQRILIAIASILNPKIIFTDEPTASLDVTTQIEIMNLLKELNNKQSLSIILISHNYELIKNYTNKVAVMYAGEIVEYGDTSNIVNKPLHPYTQMLISSVPKIGIKRLNPIAGQPPDFFNLPQGCRFHPRCPHVMEKCKKISPLTFQIDSQKVNCWIYE